MSSYRFKQFLENIALLLVDKEFDKAALVAARVLNQIQRFEDWTALHQTLQRSCSVNTIQAHSELVRIYARALMGSQQNISFIQEFLTVARNVHQPPITASLDTEIAAIEVILQQPQAALERLEQAIPHLDGLDLGLAYSRLGQTKAKLKHPDFPQAFAKMRQHLRGRDLGIQILQEGNTWYFLDLQNAKRCYQEASDLLSKDTLNHAHAEANLGLVLLLECDPIAHSHLENAEKRTRHKRYTSQHTEFLKALAASHRTRGEWDRAMLLYRRALQHTTRPDHKLEVLTNMARTERLAYRDTAQATLECAFAVAKEANLNPSVAQLEQIALWLKTDHQDFAPAFASLSGLQGADLEFAALLRAEHARKRGEAFVGFLEAINLEHRLAREEAPHWSVLWEHVAKLGLPQPKSMTIRERIVKIYANTVVVNDSQRTLTPKSRQLLEYLLGKDRHVEKTTFDTDFPDLSSSAAKKLFWRFRDDMGWHDSLIATARSRFLDPSATWQDLRRPDSTSLRVSNHHKFR
jgi:tetratricopeptide (TPR) repeat protein